MSGKLRTHAENLQDIGVGLGAADKNHRPANKLEAVIYGDAVIALAVAENAPLDAAKDVPGASSDVFGEVSRGLG